MTLAWPATQWPCWGVAMKWWGLLIPGPFACLPVLHWYEWAKVLLKIYHQEGLGWCVHGCVFTIWCHGYPSDDLATTVTGIENIEQLTLLILRTLLSRIPIKRWLVFVLKLKFYLHLGLAARRPWLLIIASSFLPRLLAPLKQVCPSILLSLALKVLAPGTLLSTTAEGILSSLSIFVDKPPAHWHFISLTSLSVKILFSTTLQPQPLWPCIPQPCHY